MITPKQAKQIIKPKKEIIEKLEKKIDAIILKEFKSSRDEGVTIDAKIFPDYSSREWIMNSYKKHGWNVIYEFDQRGDYLIFMERNTGTYNKSKLITTGQKNY